MRCQLLYLIIIKMSQNQNQEASKKKSDEIKQLQSDSNSEERSDEGQEDDENDSYESSFIENDEAYDDYPYRGRPSYSDDDSKAKADKKSKKKDKKLKKQKKHRDEDQFDEGDLEVIDDDNSMKLKKLKKVKVVRKSSDDDEKYDDDEFENQEEDQSADAEDFGYEEEAEDQLSSMNEIIPLNKDLFEPGDLKRLTIEEEDREIVQMDIPERQIIQLRNYAKNFKKSISEAKKELEHEDKHAEAEWIYEKLKNIGYFESYEEASIKERIKKILEVIHREHLEIMYIYYYRKKIYSDYLNLEILWKIQELDEEWLVFREKHKKLENSILGFISSFIEIPKDLEDMLQHCADLKVLKYFEEYNQFNLAKRADLEGQKRKNKPVKYGFVSQVFDRKVAEELERKQIFLSPANLCHNLKMRIIDKRSKTPQVEPKAQFDEMLKTSNPENDRVRYPLLAPTQRFQTIIKYLSLQLYTYPEFRKILKEKYYKKLVISTTPTKKGNQDIDLYNKFFPVKRMKDHPISILRRDIWVLAMEAEKLDLIKVDLKFQWQLSSEENMLEKDHRDPIYMEILKYYYDSTSHKEGELWNVFRKQVIVKMLDIYFFPNFIKEVKEDLSRDGEKQIIQSCCQKFRQYLNKGPSLKEGKPIKILAMVLEDTKLGMAFVDEAGKAVFTSQITVMTDDDLRRFVGDQILLDYIKEHKPDMILIAANCRKAQTLRKQLRNPNLFTESIFCAFGEYEVPRLAAKKKLIQGISDQQTILEAISMARLKKNPMAEIISLWSDKIEENGILSMNLHPYQNFIDQKKLKASLEKVAIEVVNLVGLDINQISKNQHTQNQLQFLCGLGPKKSFVLIEKMKEEVSEIINRKRIEEFMNNNQIIYKNCSPFFKIETSLHKNLLEKVEKDKKKGKNCINNLINIDEQINLLDMTRIPEEWYAFTTRRISDAILKNNSFATDIVKYGLFQRGRKGFSNLTDETIALIEIFKHPERTRGIQWKCKQNQYFDDELVKSEIMSRFKNPRDPERVMENRETFFNLLRETPETLKRYMIMPVKILSMKNNYLNVKIPENGLFGSIKIPNNKSEDFEKMYEVNTYIKAIIIGFPFDEKKYRQQSEEEKQLLKIEMALEFPHRSDERHDCFMTCFPSIVKEIHPTIDLDKDRFDLRKEDRPTLEVREDKGPKNIRTQFRRITHPKFKNISAGPAIEMMKGEPIGEYVYRPSSQGPQYLTITWNFFKGVVAHIKIKSEHKMSGNTNYIYRVQDKDNKSFNSLEEIFEKYIKPMNLLVQDVISHKKFLPNHLDQIEDKIKRQMQANNNNIYYYFACSPEYPQYFILIYMYKDKRPIKELIKVRSTGLYFHEQQFQNLKDLIIWFKEHLKEKEYQKYVKNYAIKK